jgi:hypothetical protein
MFGQIAVLATLIAPVAAIAADREPELLAREGKWVANYDVDGCHLIAQFGTGDRAVYARFTRYAPGDGFNFDVISKRLRSPEVRSKATVDFGIGGKEEQNVMRGSVGERPAVFFRGLRIDGWNSKGEDDVAPPVTPEVEKRVTGVTVTAAGTRPFRLALDAFDKPMAALRTCMTSLVKSWGYDPTVYAELARRAEPLESPAKWFHPSDYPGGALSGGHNGIVQFRLDIDPRGAIAGCKVLARTSPDEFADHTCRLITKRGKFRPALDAAQQPTRSFFIGAAVWRIEA